MEIKDFLDLAQLGAVGILLYINRDLWTRLNALQDRLLEYLESHQINAMIIQAQTEELRRMQAENSARANSQEETD
jgi:hypothetical protein